MRTTQIDLIADWLCVAYNFHKLHRENSAVAPAKEFKAAKHHRRDDGQTQHTHWYIFIADFCAQKMLFLLVINKSEIDLLNVIRKRAEREMSDRSCFVLFCRLLNLIRDRGNFSWLRNYGRIRPVFTDCCDARELDHATLWSYHKLTSSNVGAIDEAKLKLSVESGRTNRNRDHTRTCLKRNWASERREEKSHCVAAEKLHEQIWRKYSTEQSPQQ